MLLNRLHKCLLIILAIGFSCHTLVAQSQLNFNDTTLIFKNAKGQVMGKDSIINLFKKGPVMMIKQASVGGKEVYMLVQEPKEEGAMKAFSSERLREKWVNKPFPSFELSSIAGASMNETDFNGKVTVLNFWFTGCKPCIAEMPKLNKLKSDYAGKAVQFWSISFNDKDEIEKFLQKNDFDFMHIPSGKKLIEQLGVEVYPTSIVLDEQGIVKEIIIGAFEDIDKQLMESIENIKK